MFSGAHPITKSIEDNLRDARTALHARETPPTDAREDEDLDEVEDAKKTITREKDYNLFWGQQIDLYKKLPLYSRRWVFAQVFFVPCILCAHAPPHKNFQHFWGVYAR